MKNTPPTTRNLWFYVSLLPSILAVSGIILSFLTHGSNWGGDEKNISMIIALFFTEITFVSAMAGLLSYVFQVEKTSLIKIILVINSMLVFATLGLNLYLFLGR